MIQGAKGRTGVVWAALAAALIAVGCGSSGSSQTTSGTGGNSSSGGAGAGTGGSSGGGSGGSSGGGSGGTTGAGSGGSSASGGAGGKTDAGADSATGTGGAGGTIDAGKVDGGGAGGTVGADASPTDGGGQGSCPATGLAGAGVVKIAKNGTTFTMTRDGAPYYIKGIAGGSNLGLAQTYGVNSTRTFGSEGAMALLDDARSHCITVLLGIGLSQMAGDYTDPNFTNGKRAEVMTLLSTIKNHPALLMWALGNEINLGADTQAAWTFVGQLAQLIHQQDPNHPVITVFAGANVGAINNAVRWAQGIDAIGINSYAAVGTVNRDVAPSTFTGPIIVTEWGPTGHWESPNTAWARPIEETSGAKARVYKTRYEAFSHTGRVLGDYVFLWGQKIERTPTWYGMFLETNGDLGLKGESLGTVDTMAFEWSGAYPANRAPDVTAFTLNGQVATNSVTLTTNQSVQAKVTVTDPDGDPLSYAWEILQDPAQPDLKGAPEPREPRVGTVQKSTTPTLMITTPGQSGQYRLFVYVTDGKGHAGTANIPFKVN